jgi:putative transposase
LERKQDALYKQIGKLQIENDFLKKKVQTIVRDRTAAIEPDHPALSIREQCRILGITRASYYYKAVEKDEDRDLAILNAIWIAKTELSITFTWNGSGVLTIVELWYTR